MRDVFSNLEGESIGRRQSSTCQRKDSSDGSKHDEQAFQPHDCVDIDPGGRRFLNGEKSIRSSLKVKQCSRADQCVPFKRNVIVGEVFLFRLVSIGRSLRGEDFQISYACDVLSCVLLSMVWRSNI